MTALLHLYEQQHLPITADSALLYLDSNLYIKELNANAEKLLGCTRNLLLGQNIIDIFKLHRSHFPYMPEDLRSETKTFYSFISTFKYFNQNEISIDWTIEKFDKNVDFTYLIFSKRVPERLAINNHTMFSHSIIHEVTESMRNYTHENRSLTLLNNIVHALPGCAHLKDYRDLSYRIVNKATLDLVGMKMANELIGKDDYDLAKHMKSKWPSNFAQELQDYDMSVIINKEPIIALEEKPYLNAEGKLVVNSLTKIPLFDAEENPIGILTFATDISNLKNSSSLRALYRQVHINKKQAHREFIRHIGLDKFMSPSYMITEKELDCLIAYSQGKTAKHIANEFFSSIRTIESHLESVKHKLNCNNRSDLIEIFLSVYKN